MGLKETGLQSDPWQSLKDIGSLLERERQPVDYTTIINGNRVVLLGEYHSNDPIRIHLAQHVDEFRAAGITHYAIEISESANPLLEKLNKGRHVDLSKIDLGPARGGHYEDVVLAMAKSGIKIVAIDSPYFLINVAGRESEMAGNIMSIIRNDASTKVVALVGLWHTFKNKKLYRANTMARRLINAGIPIVSVAYAGGVDETPPILTQGAKTAGIDNKDFMLDLRPYALSQNVAYEGNSDWVVHLPQTPYPPSGLI